MMKQPAKVSVIIPCYNCALTLQRAFNSVLSQTVQPAEILLIDDKSTDNTLEIIKQSIVAFPLKIKIIELTVNQGAANARNAGWEVATQPYIAFLDSDDTWHPKKIEIQ